MYFDLKTKVIYLYIKFIKTSKMCNYIIYNLLQICIYLFHNAYFLGTHHLILAKRLSRDFSGNF